MQQYVFKCVRSNRTSAIQSRGGVNVPHSSLFLIHLRIAVARWHWHWLLVYFISFIELYDILLPPQIKLRNAIAIGFQNPVSVQRQFYIKCSRNICDLLMS